MVTLEEHRCPQCGKELGRNTVICIDCGINVETGQRFDAQVSVEEVEDPHEPEEEQFAEPGLARRWTLYFAAVFPGVVRPGMVIFSVIIMVAGIAILAFGLALALGALVQPFPFEGMAISAAGLVLWAQAWGWIMTDEFSVMPNTFVEFDEERWWAFVFLMMLPIAGMILLMVLMRGNTQ